MKNPLYLLTYLAGFYGDRIIAFLKRLLVVVIVTVLIYYVMLVFDLTIEIKRSGDLLWFIKWQKNIKVTENIEHH